MTLMKSVGKVSDPVIYLLYQATAPAPARAIWS
jgi:hypothetical protein